MLHRNTKIIATLGSIFFILSITTCGLFFHIVSNKKAQLLAQNIERAEAKSHQDSLISLTQMLEDTTVEREALTTRILKEKDVIDFLALIETVGKEQGAMLVTNTLTIQPINAVFETLVVNVSVEGSYGSVMRTLKLLEHLPYHTIIRGVQVSGEKTEWNSTFEIRVTKFKNHEA